MRSCSYSTGWKWFFIVVGVVFAAAAATCFAADLPLFGLALAPMAGVPWIVLQERIEYDDQRIVHRTLLRTHSMLRASIRGRRLYVYQHGIREVALISELPSEKPLKVPGMFALDPELRDWIQELPDLDQQERESELQRLVEQFGTDTVAHRRPMAKVLNALGLACAAWAWFWPRPYHPVLIANIAVFAAAFFTAVRSRGGYAVDSSRKDPRPSLGPALIFPGLAIALRMSLDVRLVSWTRPLLLAAGAGAIIAVALLLTAPRERQKPWLFLLWAPIFAAAPFGALVYANVALDRRPPVRYEAVVQGKYIAHGKRTEWRLRLEPWGPFEEAKDEEVSRASYARVKPGQQLTVRLYPGRLDIPWFVVELP
ncbi:MAG TPA: hypothetical protein VGH20_05360 [Myxococcales bacterium]|jgi:hypothetical protein